jgi:transcriptional regulator with XRE-family HTH domain
LEVLVMVNMNEIISNNIINIMKQNGKKQIDLAGYLGVSKQIISKMLSGVRVINAVELQKIAEFLGVSMESLVKIPQVIPEANVVKAFMGRVESTEAKEGLKIADEIADMICFYARTRENAEKMLQPWEA